MGETGLDFYRDRSGGADQRRAFAAQISIANLVRKPLVIHMRDLDGSEDAVTECIDTLEQAAECDVILHCFSAAPKWAERAADNGWYCSFAGNSTYPRARGLREAAASVPEDRILVETDSPFLAPQPVRGKPNQPATWSRPPSGSRRCAESPTRSSRGSSRRTPRASSAGEPREYPRVHSRRGQRQAASERQAAAPGPELPRRLEPARRDRARGRGGARRHGAGGRRRRRGADGEAGRSGRARPRDRARRASPRRSRPLGGGRRQRRHHLGRRDEGGSRGSRPAAVEDGREPALFGRDAAPAADDRRAPLGGVLVRDGPARDRRAPAREAGDARVRLAERRGPARLRCEPGPDRRPRRVHAAPARGVGAAPHGADGPGRAPELEALVREAFAHRRKSLARSLEHAQPGRLKAVRTALESIGVPAGARAQELSPDQFEQLRRSLA